MESWDIEINSAFCEWRTYERPHDHCCMEENFGRFCSKDNCPIKKNNIRPAPPATKEDALIEKYTNIIFGDTKLSIQDVPKIKQILCDMLGEVKG